MLVLSIFPVGNHHVLVGGSTPECTWNSTSDMRTPLVKSINFDPCTNSKVALLTS